MELVWSGGFVWVGTRRPDMRAYYPQSSQSFIHFITLCFASFIDLFKLNLLINIQRNGKNYYDLKIYLYITIVYYGFEY